MKSERQIMLQEYICTVKEDNKEESKIEITIGWIDKDYFSNNHRKTKEGLPAIATVICSKELLEKYKMEVNDPVNFPFILIRKDIKDFATEDELKALIKHEIVHFIKKHEETITHEEADKQHKEVNKEMTEEEITLLSLLNSRLISYKGIF